jgi:NitT/TauT family transport system substrate-binding protein
MRTITREHTRCPQARAVLAHAVREGRGGQMRTAIRGRRRAPHRRRLPALLLAIGVFAAACQDTPDEAADDTPTATQEDTEATDDTTDEQAAGSEVCSPDDPRQMTLTTSSEGFLYFPHYVAQEMGYYDDAGVEVEYFVAGGGHMPAMMAGEVDMVETAFTSVVNLRNEGQEPVAIGSYINAYASNVVVQGEVIERHGITEDSSFEDRARALEGLTIGTTSPGAGADLLPRAILREVDLDPEADAEILYLEQGAAMLAAFDQGRIDAFVLSSPSATQAVVNMGGEILINPTLGEYPAVDGIAYVTPVTRAQWLEDEENRTTAGCYLLAVDRALQLIQDDPEAALEAAKGHPNMPEMDDEILDQAFEETRQGYPPTVCLSEENVQTALDFDDLFRTVQHPAEDHYDSTICEEFVGG